MLYHLVLMSTTTAQLISPEDLIHIFGEREIQFVEEQQFMQFGSFNEAVTTFEKNFLLYLLKKNHYNIEQVACQLSLPPTELQSKINELNIQT